MNKICLFPSFVFVFFLTGCSTPVRVIDLYLEDAHGYEIVDITIVDADNNQKMYVAHENKEEGKLQIDIPKKKQDINLKFYKHKEGYMDYKPRNIYKQQYITLTPTETEISLTFEKTNSYLKHEMMLDELIENTQIVKGRVVDDTGQPLSDVFVKVLDLPLELDDENFWAITDAHGRFRVRANEQYNQIQFNHRNHHERIVTVTDLEKLITVKLRLAIIDQQ